MKLVRTLFICLALLASFFFFFQDRDAPVLIGHASLPRIDLISVQRLYTGRAVEVSGTPVTVVNAAAGSTLRERFMSEVMN